MRPLSFTVRGQRLKLITLVLSLALASCVSAGLSAHLSKHYGGIPTFGYIEFEAYYVCLKSRTLIGGIFGKGPTRHFGRWPSSCETPEWQLIPKANFTQLATQWYGTDWSHEPPFFSASYTGPASLVGKPAP